MKIYQMLVVNDQKFGIHVCANRKNLRKRNNIIELVFTFGINLLLFGTFRRYPLQGGPK